MNGWRVALAVALDEQADQIRAVLAELAELEPMLEARGADQLGGELRGFTAGLRLEASTIESEARELRADVVDMPRGLPIALTTRTVRGNE